MKRTICFYMGLVLINLFILKTRGFSLMGAANKAVPHFSNNKFLPTPNLVNKNFYKKCDPCPKNSYCVPSIQCPAHVRMKGDSKLQICDLPHGSHGLCCSTGRNHTDKTFDAPDNGPRARMATNNNGVANTNLTGAIQEARSELLKMVNKESKMAIVTKGQPEFMHNLVFKSSPQSQMRSMELQRKAMERVLTSQIYKRKKHISNEDFELGQVQQYFDGTPLQNTCNEYIPCPPIKSKYHSQDGRCNHPDPAKASWGAAGSPMERLLPPSYHDGIWESRHLSVDGTPLTNARTISRILLRDADRPHANINLFFMQFGQFITHDVTQSASITTSDGRSVTCCTEDGSRALPPEFMHYSCFPIDIDPEDDFYSSFRQGCINFVRSSLSPDGECRLNYGKQLSKVTHILDASVIYGSDLKTQEELRSFVGGRLLMPNDFGREMLPLTMDKAACVTLENGPCYFTGDGRANQIISLTAIHTLFGREHNRLADMLAQLNPRWSDELLFYEARRIVIAKLQHVIYKEWLPIVIGSERMIRFGLHLTEDGYSIDFNPEVNPRITSEFSTAAMRFGHSTVDGKFLIHKGSNIDEIIDIPDVMFNPGRMRQPHFYDEIILSLERQPAQQADAVISAGLSRYLFRGQNPFGLDLAAINIQRGRDHAVRPYNDYLELSGYKRIISFDEFGPEIGPKLASVYRHPDDVDLWIGGLLESSDTDALVGPTFADIIGDQFSKSRQGDNYFYEHSPDINPGFFSPGQLREIKKTTLARIICDNADGIQSQSPNVLLRPDIPGNAPVSCGDAAIIPVLDYSAWAEV